VLRKIFGPKREGRMVRSFTICFHHHLVCVIKPGRLRLQHMFAHVEERRNACRVVVETP
jgi:hypothetical protein